MNNKGKTIWVQTYEMKAPIAVVNGSFAAIADQQGNSIYIFNEEESQGCATTLLPIVRISVSGKGNCSGRPGGFQVQLCVHV